MKKEDYARIFLESHPGFFEGKELKDFPEGRVCEEMFLPLEQYDETALSIPLVIMTVTERCYWQQLMR